MYLRVSGPWPRLRARATFVSPNRFIRSPSFSQHNCQKDGSVLVLRQGNSRLAIYFCACCRRRKLLPSNSMTTLRSQSHANAHTLFRLANSQQFAYIRPIHDYNASQRKGGAKLRDRWLWDTRCLPPNRGCSTRFNVWASSAVQTPFVLPQSPSSSSFSW